MKTNDRYTSLLYRVSTQMIATYEKSVNVNLRAENVKFVQSEQALATATRFKTGIFFVTLLAPIPLAGMVRWSGMINNLFGQIVIAVILTGAVASIALIYLHRMERAALKVRNASGSILEQFEKAAESIDSEGIKKPLNREAVKKNLIAMAQEVADAEHLEKFLITSQRTDYVPDIVSVITNTRDKKQRLADALAAQARFGFNFTRRELFQEVVKE